jgi:histidinol-phosphate aminotransferase
MSISNRIESLVRPEVQALAAYKTVPPGDCIKLDAMENPYAWPAEMVESWLEKVRSAEINRYPDPAAERLKKALYKHQAVPERKALLLGNGSDEIIQIILMAVAGPGVVVLAPEPAFVMYRQIAVSLGLEFKGVPLDSSDFSLDFKATCDAIKLEQPAVIFLAYPNNPTGNLFNREEMEEIIRLAPGLVVVDEAYVPFTDASFIDCTDFDENLLVMRTVSKLGLAGLRLGYLVGDEGWIEQFEKIRLPYNINVLTQITAEFALENREVFEEQTVRIRQDRAELFERLDGLDGIEPLPSDANFILFRVKNQAIDPLVVHSKLKKSGILIKNLHGSMPLLDRCLRVTVGASNENDAFLDALVEIMKIK